MNRQLRSTSRKREGFETEALGLYDELVSWRKEHPQATFDEIAGQVRAGRKRLMGQLLEELASQEIEREVWQERECPACGGSWRTKG